MCIYIYIYIHIGYRTVPGVGTSVACNRLLPRLPVMSRGRPHGRLLLTVVATPAPYSYTWMVPRNYPWLLPRFAVSNRGCYPGSLPWPGLLPWLLAVPWGGDAGALQPTAVETAVPSLGGFGSPCFCFALVCCRPNHFSAW